MRDHAGDHQDRQTGTINATRLAEDAASRLDLYARDGSIPQDLLDWAAEVADQLECQ
jgi:hypothetical protein